MSHFIKPRETLGAALLPPLTLNIRFFFSTDKEKAFLVLTVELRKRKLIFKRLFSHLIVNTAVYSVHLKTTVTAGIKVEIQFQL